MKHRRLGAAAFLAAAIACFAATAAFAQTVSLPTQKFDPYGFPRPGSGHTNVPLRTSFYFKLVGPNNNADPVHPISVTLSILPSGGPAIPILDLHETWAPGYSGALPIRDQFGRRIHRDAHVLGLEYQPQLGKAPPNIVRERETRRIKSIAAQGGDVVLEVEDFFGHEQYGIASGRPLSGGYHPGDVVLIAVDDAASTVLISSIPTTGWAIAYAGALPTEEDPRAPGLFPPGGCYLRKFNPLGTPHYCGADPGGVQLT